MDEWTGIAFGAFALSSFVSALRIGHWILHAEPRAIVNAGRWSLVFIALVSLAVLLWLIESGRWTNAMLLAAFILFLCRPRQGGDCCLARSNSRPPGGSPWPQISAKAVNSTVTVACAIPSIRRWWSSVPLSWRLTSRRLDAKSPINRMGELARKDTQWAPPTAPVAGACRLRRPSMSWGSSPPRVPMKSEKRTAGCKRNSTPYLAERDIS